MPIRVVAPSINDGLSRVRKEIEKVRGRTSLSPQAGMALSTSPLSTAASFDSASVTSVSFEDDDAVFTHVGGSGRVANTESTSTGFTSEESEGSEPGGGGVKEEHHLFFDDFDDLGVKEADSK